MVSIAASRQVCLSSDRSPSMAPTSLCEARLILRNAFRPAFVSRSRLRRPSVFEGFFTKRLRFSKALRTRLR